MKRNEMTASELEGAEDNEEFRLTKKERLKGDESTDQSSKNVDINELKQRLYQQLIDILDIDIIDLILQVVPAQVQTTYEAKMAKRHLEDIHNEAQAQSRYEAKLANCFLEEMDKEFVALNRPSRSKEEKLRDLLSALKPGQLQDLEAKLTQRDSPCAPPFK